MGSHPSGSMPEVSREGLEGRGLPGGKHMENGKPYLTNMLMTQ